MWRLLFQFSCVFLACTQWIFLNVWKKKFYSLAVNEKSDPGTVYIEQTFCWKNSWSSGGKRGQEDHLPPGVSELSGEERKKKQTEKCDSETSNTTNDQLDH